MSVAGAASSRTDGGRPQTEVAGERQRGAAHPCAVVDRLAPAAAASSRPPGRSSPGSPTCAAAPRAGGGAPRRKPTRRLCVRRLAANEKPRRVDARRGASAPGPAGAHERRDVGPGGRRAGVEARRARRPARQRVAGPASGETGRPAARIATASASVAGRGRRRRLRRQRGAQHGRLPALAAAPSPRRAQRGGGVLRRYPRPRAPAGGATSTASGGHDSRRGRRLRPRARPSGGALTTRTATGAPAERRRRRRTSRR